METGHLILIFLPRLSICRTGTAFDILGNLCPTTTSAISIQFGSEKVTCDIAGPLGCMCDNQPNKTITNIFACHKLFLNEAFITKGNSNRFGKISYYLLARRRTNVEYLGLRGKWFSGRRGLLPVEISATGVTRT